MELRGQQLPLNEIAAIAHGLETVGMSAAGQAIASAASRKAIDDIVERNEIAYGVTTGFGKLSEMRDSQRQSCVICN